MKQILLKKFLIIATCFTFLFVSIFGGVPLVNHLFSPQISYAAQKTSPQKSVKKVKKPAKKKIVKKSVKKKKAPVSSKKTPFFEVAFAPAFAPPAGGSGAAQPTFPIPLFTESAKKDDTVIYTPLPPLPNGVTQKAAPKKEVFLPQPFFLKTTPQSTSLLTQQGILQETNNARAQNGKLSALTLNQQLSRAAELKVDDMFQKQYFEHVSPSGEGPSDVVKKAEYQYIAIGENLALGNFENDLDLVTGWMNSPGHRANILHTKFQEIGIAVKKGMYKGEMVWLAVQEFGKPLSACPSPDASIKNLIEFEKQNLVKIKLSLEIQKNDITNAKNNPATTQESFQILIDEYNATVAAHNEKVSLINKYVTDYNTQVTSFNTCIDL